MNIENIDEQLEQYQNDLTFDIEQYINKCGYTWTAQQIADEYINKYCKGYYVSYTCKEIINKFAERLGKATSIKPNYKN